MNANIGYWLAILVLGVAALFGNIQYYKQQTEMDLNRQKLRATTADDLVNVYKNESVTQLKLDSAKFEEDLGTSKATIDDLKKEIDNLNINPLMVVGDNDLLIPFRPDFVTKIDFRKKQVKVSLPEGLLNINN